MDTKGRKFQPARVWGIDIFAILCYDSYRKKGYDEDIRHRKMLREEPVC